MNGTRSTIPVGTGDERWHGTVGGYTNHRCGCVDCKAAQAACQVRAKARRTAGPTPEHVHGTSNGYAAYGCRCAECTKAHSMACAARARERAGRTAPTKPYKRQPTPAEREATRVEIAAQKRARDEARAEKREQKALARKSARPVGRPRTREPRVKVPKATFAERHKVNAETGCWEWQGKLSCGYGNYKGMSAHRWSHLESGRAIPDKYHVDHLCRNRCCVNPAHLEAVTALENFTRGANKSATALREGICSNGHPFTGSNVRERTHDNRQECVQCNRDRSKRYRAKIARHAEDSQMFAEIVTIM